MSVVLLNQGEFTQLAITSVGGSRPQVTGDRTYTLDGIYCNGVISFHLSDSEGDYSKTVSITDSTYTSGDVGFHGEMNASPPPAVFFDHFTVVEWCP